MAGQTYGARAIISIDGTPLSPEIERLVRRVVVETDAQAPDGCRIVFEDPQRDVLQRAGVAFHATLKVQAGRTGEDAGHDLFEGKVYSLGVDYDESGAVATVGAFDASYALFNGLHTATYRDVTDSDLAQQLAQEAGIGDVVAESTPVVHEHVSQVNETHWDFLRRRAAEIDYEVRVLGSRLLFQPSTQASEGPEPGGYQSTGRLQLTPGGNLEQLTVRVTAAQQVTEVEVRGWDPQNKRELVATAAARTRSAELPDSPDQLAGGDGDPRYVTTTLPLTTQAEVEAAVAGEAERIASTSAHAEGVARGDPRILPGEAVSIGAVGDRFVGKYTVTTARHVFGGSGYQTQFTVSGRHDRSVLGLVNGNGVRPPRREHGVVLGIVTNISDPENLGRVKVSLPWLADDYESHWARIAGPMAGPDRGLLLPPEVNDEAVIAFEHGDVRRPYIVGFLWNGQDKPPFEGGVDSGPGTVKLRGLRTRKGHEITVSDEDGKEQIELKTSGDKVRLVMTHDDGGLTIETRGDVVVKSEGKTTVESKGDLSLTSDGQGTISARQGLKLESGMGNVTIKGTMVELNP
jgi:uncharacterized protein involved in type VI secretion and phage assembly